MMINGRYDNYNMQEQELRLLKLRKSAVDSLKKYTPREPRALQSIPPPENFEKQFRSRDKHKAGGSHIVYRLYRL